MTITLGQFKTGTTFAGLALLKTQGLINPKASTPSYSQLVELANGTVVNRGWLQCTWEWTFETAAQYTILRTIFPNQSGTIYISTFTDDLSWVNYLCIYRFQSPLPPSDATRRIQITIQFVNMLVVTS